MYCYLLACITQFAHSFAFLSLTPSLSRATGTQRARTTSRLPNPQWTTCLHCTSAMTLPSWHHDMHAAVAAAIPAYSTIEHPGGDMLIPCTLCLVIMTHVSYPSLCALPVFTQVNVLFTILPLRPLPSHVARVGFTHRMHQATRMSFLTRCPVASD